MAFFLTHFLHRQRRLNPDVVATVGMGTQQTWAQMSDRVARLASALQHLGVKTGDRIGILSGNSAQFAEVFFASWWVGAVVNPVNLRWSTPEMVYSLDDCQTEVLIVNDRFKAQALELQARSKSLRTIIHFGDGQTDPAMLSYESLISDAAPIPDADRNGTDLAAIFYTGGTTGFPKGVMVTHDNLCGSALNSRATVGMTPGTSALLIAPMFHVGGAAQMLTSIIDGKKMAFIPAFTPSDFLQAIQTHQIDYTFLVPTMIQMVLDHPARNEYDTRSLKTLSYGGSPISEGVLRRTRQAFPNAALRQNYGMTEFAGTITVLGPQFHTEQGESLGKLKSAGHPMLMSRIEIVDANGKEVPANTVGEIRVRSPGVMVGYWNKPELTAAALRDGWLYTGDAGRMDEDGFLFIVDRVKDMIVTGGENVYSAEVEQALAQHPSVAMSAVIGIPDDKWGEAVHAIVQLKNGHNVSAEALIEHVRELIANYKAPRSVEFRDALPISGAGKIQKGDLRKPFWDSRDRQIS